MTVTAPLPTTEELIIGDNLPVIIADTHELSEADQYSVLRDPIVPFLLVGVATFVALVVAAYLLTAPIAA